MTTDIQNFIFDLDGVIWRGQTAIPGAVDSVARLQAAGKRCLYCTNNSKPTQNQLAERLRAIGLQLHDDEVITSSSATALYLAGRMKGPFTAYVIGGTGLVSALESVGAQVQQGEEHEPPEVDCVVVGIDRAFTYGKMRIAQRLIMQGALFVATNRDPTFPTEEGLVPGAGSVVAAVETAAGVSPVTVGKPEPLMVQLCLQRFGLDPERTAIVGDRLDTDIACALRAGITGLLVATGVTSLEQAAHAAEDMRPHACFEHLPEMCRALIG